MRNVHVVDTRLFGNEAALNSFMGTLDNLPGSNVAFRVDGQWSLHRICSRVRHLAGMVGVLRFYCHGNASWIQLGPALSEPSQTADFQVLRNCWVGRYPRIEFHSCGVVSATPVSCTVTHTTVEQLPHVCVAGTSAPDTPGHQLVQAIADNAGVLVIAALNVQLIGAIPNFEGPVVYCRPAEYHTAARLIGS